MPVNGVPRSCRSRKRLIYLVGEGTGETISRIARAALAQFPRSRVAVRTFFLVTNKSTVSRIVREAQESGGLVAFSIVEASLRDYLVTEARRRGITAIDVIGDFILQLSLFLGEKPSAKPGGQYILDENYFRRIDAINFAVSHDDGKNIAGLTSADIVLVGLSRTGKTPLSTYLANQGWKVSNVPLHPDVVAPQELFRVPPRKVFGLIISVESLVRMRESRIRQMGMPLSSHYADPVRVSAEIEWSRQFFALHPKWNVLDISNKAIEETSAAILSLYRRSPGRRKEFGRL